MDEYLPNGKCISKRCTGCNFFYTWDMTNKEGLRESRKKCLFRVLAEEIPRIRGAIDGVQAAANESRNRAIETKQRVEDFGTAMVIASERNKQLENK